MVKKDQLEDILTKLLIEHRFCELTNDINILDSSNMA